jgi:diguanylate cyclase (GGDEF)-like protein
MVLVADDSATVRSALRHHLTARGYEVQEAADGEAALAAIRRTRPDAVLLDVEMPVLDGHGVLTALRADGDLSVIPVVFLSASPDVDGVAKGLEAGAHDYLRKPFEAAELVARVAAAVRVKRLQDELRRRYDELNALARRDALTGLYNRGHLDEHLRTLASASRRHRVAVSVALIDLDRFKAVNDTYGHPVGDDVLRAAAESLQRVIRSEDVLGRWGGEELMVLLPYIDEAGAARAGERIRAAVAGTSVRAPDGTPIVVTASVGVCTGRGVDAEELVRQADQALYRAKAAGRNQVVAVSLKSAPSLGGSASPPEADPPNGRQGKG